MLEKIIASSSDEETTDMIDLSKYEIIDYKQTPKKENWFFKPLYQDTNNGKRMIWMIGFSSETEELVTINYYEDSDKKRIFRREVEAKGKKDIQEQALQEAKRKMEDKIFNGYSNKETEKVERIKDYFILPMLANDYTKVKNPIKFFPVMVQRKLDGARNMATIRGDNVIMVSRELRERKHFEHMRDEIFKLSKFLPKNIILDGELYSEGENFQDIISIVKKDLEKSDNEDKIKYNIFDIMMEDKPTDERVKILSEAFENYKEKYGKPKIISLVQSYVANNDQEIKEYFKQFLKENYEGLMIRHMTPEDKKLRTDKNMKMTYYKQKRSNNLLKYKEFMEEEGVIVDIIDAKGNERCLALFQIKLDGGNIIVVKPATTFEERAEYFKNKNKYIGKKYTIKYFELTKDGIPKFPTGKGFRDYD